MEEMKEENRNNKRPRADSGLELPESKRVNSTELDRVDPEVFDADVDLDSPEAKQIREDILDILDEPDFPAESPAEIPDLDSVMRSFESEILHRSISDDPQTVLDLTSSESGESQPDLGYLLGASDDDLGLPPTVSPVAGDSAADLANIAAGFENEMPNYDTFDFGMDAGVVAGDVAGGDNSGEFLNVGGIFDYSDFSEFSWRQESLPAL